MLDSITKRKINTSRDILVGKVPDPKSQIEQITLALVYKFMNDTDKTLIELGGKASYFINDYQRFSWDNIIDPRLTGQERMNLYTEGLERMGRNPHLPELFRNVFKNAFLPFRSPETLKMFLGEIDGFQYDHSERLGDAYEYLLSIMSSQGDAGQFRTPRHIIDFIVKVVDPYKEDTILDPACGTAGFLISAMKHIQHYNTKDFTGDLLDIEDKKRLADSVVGYEISPDMRRISLVNMFLHQIPEPHIYEYDTLSDQDRWDDDFSCILANPPFMSPKGGIKPHERFGIKSTRSEVLFVDYIMEHLNIDGKAGVIVPEGIIFQSQKAFQNLRKKMVEDCFLWAVLSLPSGVFNPYSGVKTSILFFDRQIAKNIDKVLFVKIDADGYGLGAQRRSTAANDLPEAYNNLLYFKKHYQELPPEKRSKHSGSIYLAHTATKHDIKAQDYILSANRYLIPEVRTGKWQRVKLGEVCELLDYKRIPITKEKRTSGIYPYYGATGILDYVDDYIFEEKLVLIGEDGAKWDEGDNTAFIATGRYWVNNHAHVLKPYRKLILDELLVELINSMDLRNYVTGITVPKLNQANLRSIELPLPPLEVQKEIVAEIESYQKIIDGAKQIIDNWKPKIDIDPDWQIVKLEMVATVKSGGTPSRQVKEFWNGTIPWIGSSACKDTPVYEAQEFITQQGLDKSSAKLFRKKTTLIALVGATIGKTGLLMIESATNQNIAGLYPKDEQVIMPEYLFNACRLMYNHFQQLGEGKFRMANLSFIRKLEIPLPPLAIQQQIVSCIEIEQTYTDNCKKLIEIYQTKIQDRINKVWEE